MENLHLTEAQAEYMQELAAENKLADCTVCQGFGFILIDGYPQAECSCINQFVEENY